MAETTGSALAAQKNTTPSVDNVVVLKDASGRELKVRPLDVLYESRLARMLGAEATANQAYMMGFVLPAASVFEIDGVPCPPPVTQKELDDAIARLGRDGIAAVLQRMQQEMEDLKGLIDKASAAKDAA